jgi:uracil DNA glycosylase superfamily protein
MSICVVEGPDGTGKTTLARALEKRGFRYVHNGPPAPGESLFESYTQQLLACGGQDTIFDRLHVGELIYGPVMRGKSLITVEEMRLLNRLLFSLGGKVVFCNTDDGTIEKNWLARRGQEYIDDGDKLYEVIHQYRRIFDQEFTGRDTIIFDYKNSYLLDRITQHFPYDEAPELFRRRGCLNGVVGSPDARFLFVGERTNELNSATKHDLAFYTMDNASGFLNHCLWDAGYQEWEMTFTNAVTVAGVSRNLYRLWREDKQQVVIALGKVAHQACVNQAVPHLEAPHPSYVKRFDSKKRNLYVELLNRFRGGL